MSKQLSEWVAITKDGGWSEFYSSFLGRPLSDKKRFLRAVDNFGQDIMFASVIAASGRNLEGDPLNYVLGIAIQKANEAATASLEDERYRRKLEQSKHRVLTQNEELEDKFEKARRNE